MMLGISIIDHRVQSRSLAEYAVDWAKSGVQVLPGKPGTFWTQYESWAMVRRPTFYMGPPEPHEVRNILWQARAAVASYLLEADEAHPANAWLYVCTDQTYTVEKLAPDVRHNVRRGLRELRITPLTAQELLRHGVQAFCDTRCRNGLSDGTPEEFRRRYTAEARIPEIVFFGAWRDDQLAAFLSIIEVDDWADIGCFSVDALRRYKPNDALVYSAIAYYLLERKFRLVTYGLSSIQEVSNLAGLHRFKTKLGFEAHPVHRVFEPHPLLRPFANRWTLRGVNTLLRFRPKDRVLKKACGALACMLGETLHSLM